MSLFKQYKESRDKLSSIFGKEGWSKKEWDEIKEAMKKGDDIEKNEGLQWQGNELVCRDRKKEICARLAVKRALDYLGTGKKQYPNILGLDKAFPGVDPNEKYSRVEMGLALRVKQLETVLSMCTVPGDPQDPNAPNKEILDRFFQKGGGKYIKDLWGSSNAVAYCEKIQKARDAAKFCPDEDISMELEDLANDMEWNALEKVQDIAWAHQILTALEQVMGLKEGPLDPNGAQLLRDKLGLSIPSYISTGKNVQRNMPDQREGLEKKLEIKISGTVVNTEEMDHILEQEMRADPKNLCKRLEMTRKLDAGTRMLRSAKYETQNMLTIRFGLLEEMWEDPRSIDGLNRGTLIIVNGKTVGELMQESYEKWVRSNYNTEDCKKVLKNDKIFRQWYHKNLDEKSAQFVFDALRAGKPVEAYIPDPDGKLPQRPVQLRFDYDWERALRISEQTNPQPQDMEAARDRLKANYRTIEAKRLDPSSRFTTDLFLERFYSKGRQAKLFESMHSAIVPICIGMMVADGVDIEVITDPAQKEKRDAMIKRYVAECNEPGYKKWMGEQIFRGQRALLNQINQKMKGIDLTNPKARDEVLPKIYPAARALSEMLQYMEKHGEVKAAYREAVKNKEKDMAPEQIDMMVTAIMDDATNVSAMCDVMYRAAFFRTVMSRQLPLTNAGAMSRGMASPTNEDEISAGLAAQLAEGYVFQRYAVDSKAPFTEKCLPAKDLEKLDESIRSMSEHKENVQLLARGWKESEEGAKYVHSEDFTDGVVLYDYDTTPQGKVQEESHFMYPPKLTAELKEKTNPPPPLQVTYYIGYGGLC